MKESEGQPKAESVWNSRLFKGGLVFAVIGSAVGISVLAEVGVIAVGAGAGWHWAMKGKSK